PEKAKLFCLRQEGVGENTLSRFRAVWLLAAGAARPGFPVGKAPPFEKGRPPRHAAARGGAGYESSIACTKLTRPSFASAKLAALPQASAVRVKFRLHKTYSGKKQIYRENFSPGAQHGESEE